VLLRLKKAVASFVNYHPPPSFLIRFDPHMWHFSDFVIEDCIPTWTQVSITPANPIAPHPSNGFSASTVPLATFRAPFSPQCLPPHGRLYNSHPRQHLNGAQNACHVHLNNTTFPYLRSGTYVATLRPLLRAWKYSSTVRRLARLRACSGIKMAQVGFGV